MSAFPPIADMLPHLVKVRSVPQAHPQERLRATRPRRNQLIASSRRSSPQNNSRPTVKVGEPKMPSDRATSVSAAMVSFASSPSASTSTRAGSWPTSRRLAVRLASPPFSSPPHREPEVDLLSAHDASPSRRTLDHHGAQYRVLAENGRGAQGRVTFPRASAMPRRGEGNALWILMNQSLPNTAS